MSTTSITESRALQLTDARATVAWTVNEFNHGSVMLTVHAGAVAFDAHFDGEGWAKFQALIAGTDSQEDS